MLPVLPCILSIRRHSLASSSLVPVGMSLVTPSLADDGSAPVVFLETSLGDIEVELYCTHAPRTCKNFYNLARSGYYDGTVFHRIVKSMCVQGGDPTGTGRGGKSILEDARADGTFDCELTPKLKHTGAGILSMANRGRNTNTSQFFITLAPTPWLDGKHTIFGRVKKGMQVVRAMSEVETAQDDRPRDDVVIRHASVV